MVAGTGCNHTALQLFGGQLHHLVEGAAQLEGKNGLQVFAFEQHRMAQTLR